MTYSPVVGDRCRLPSGDIVTVVAVDALIEIVFDSGSQLAVSVTLLEPV